jgi:protein-L-isoaspartate(D-aspartate) O-methyltransferase
MPPALTSLLAPGGRLVGAVAGERLPRLLRIDRLKDGSLRQEVGTTLRIGSLTQGRSGQRLFNLNPP